MAALWRKLSEAGSKPREACRRKSPAYSNLSFGLAASPTPLTLDSGSLPSREASQAVPQAASDLPNPRFAAPDPAPGPSLAGFLFGLLCGARTPRSGGGAWTPGTSRVKPAAMAPRPDFVALCTGLPPERRREPRMPRGREPESPRCGKRSCGPGGRREGGALAAGWFGQSSRAGAELPPLASIPRPGSQTPPPVPSVLQSLARPRGHLDAGSGFRSPTPTPPPRPDWPRLGRLIHPLRCPLFSSPRCGRC